MGIVLNVWLVAQYAIQTIYQVAYPVPKDSLIVQEFVKNVAQDVSNAQMQPLVLRVT